MPLFIQLLLVPILSMFCALCLAETSSTTTTTVTRAADGKQIALKPFTAVYAAKFSGFNVTATRKLTTRGSDWQLDFSVESMFANINEYSRFSIKNGQLTPLHYQYHRTGLGKNRHTELDFEPAQRRIINLGNSRYTLTDVPVDIQDMLSYQLQLGLDLAAAKPSLKYAIADGKKIRQYSFRLIAKEQVQTPIGLVNAVKVARVQNKAERVTHLWFAPRWNYALIKLTQQEGSGKNYQIILTKLAINGNPVDGES